RLRRLIVMTKRTGLLVLAMLLSINSASPAFADGTPEKCAATKMKAATKKFASKGKCYAKALGEGTSVSGACITAAEDKFTDAFAKADAAGGCLHEADANAIEATIDASIAQIVGDLGCGNGRPEGNA